jgi:hypothetical protein
VERAEDPVPNRQAAAEILVEVLRVGRVVNLVVRRTYDHATERTGHRDPEMRMLEMSEDPHERDDQKVSACTRAERSAELQVMQNAVGRADEQAQQVTEDDAVHRMNAKVGER